MKGGKNIEKVKMLPTGAQGEVWCTKYLNNNKNDNRPEINGLSLFLKNKEQTESKISSRRGIKDGVKTKINEINSPSHSKQPPNQTKFNFQNLGHQTAVSELNSSCHRSLKKKVTKAKAGSLS